LAEAVVVVVVEEVVVVVFACEPNHEATGRGRVASFAPAGATAIEADDGRDGGCATLGRRSERVLVRLEGLTIEQLLETLESVTGIGFSMSENSGLTVVGVGGGSCTRLRPLLGGREARIGEGRTMPGVNGPDPIDNVTDAFTGRS
jgi:hypothetical protein